MPLDQSRDQNVSERASGAARLTSEPGTLAWWETWGRSPRAVLFETTDWSALARIAPLYDSHLRTPSAASAGEIRMTESSLGGT